MTKPVAVVDSEVFRDYYLLMFRDVQTGKIAYKELYPGHPFEDKKTLAILDKFTVVTFNGLHFDLPILALALSGADNKLLKKACDAIIELGMKPWQIEQLYGVTLPRLDHIDLFDVSPGMASLKAYGGRLHCRRLQDLPFDPKASISPGDRATVISYCGNDLETTEALYRSLIPQIELRKKLSDEYGLDLRSKSDAGIAETVLKAQISQQLGAAINPPKIDSGTAYSYTPPHYISYEIPALQNALATVRNAKFVVSDSGKVLIPEEVQDLRIQIGCSEYRMGIGGLHSTESCAAHVSNEDYVLVDRDVASYYPAIILQGLYPKHLGDAFLEVYRDIVKRRLKAKARGDRVVADSLKIVVNSSFGKMGSKWSALYSPDLMIQVTMTGQLALLMLIEWLELEGISVVSANTDGVVIKCPASKVELMDAMVYAWESWTGFDTEAAWYKALYSRDVNNYIALKKNGGYKAKGVFTPAGLQKNPVNLICVKAVVEYLMHGTPLAETVRSCHDITQFVTVRTVKGGAVKDGEYLGRAVRWYYAVGAVGAIHYKVNGHKVPMSEGARPLMDLPDEIPADLNHEWYIQEAGLILAAIGHA